MCSGHQNAKSQPTVTLVYGLYFSPSASDPRRIAVTTIIPLNEDIEHPRFPAVEHIMGARKATRECRVTVGDREFIVFYQHDIDALKSIEANVIVI